ncbi:hypothetical protein HK100_005410 [Physocladia obscura]|uniref:Uncharacterized protein n=1 Tax=Physocladia obscura TaxID=109957 RepID=A0AAD5XIV1_9FUNG|nr:hypothetical protein HK100_005410 [Physocladia obscura]
MRTSRNEEIIAKKHKHNFAESVSTLEKKVIESTAAAAAGSLDLEAKIRLENEKKRLEKKKKRLGNSGIQTDLTTIATAHIQKKLKINDESSVVRVFSNDVDSVAIVATGNENLQHPVECTAIMKSLAIGVNSVTKMLNPNSKVKLRLIFVCKGDAMTHMYAHIPTMAYLSGENTLLVGLPAGSEARIADALQVKTVMALGIKIDTAIFDDLYERVQKTVGPVKIPWLPRTSKRKNESPVITATAQAETATTEKTKPILTGKVNDLKDSGGYVDAKLKTLIVRDGTLGHGRGGNRGGKSNISVRKDRLGNSKGTRKVK